MKRPQTVLTTTFARRPQGAWRLGQLNYCKNHKIARAHGVAGAIHEWPLPFNRQLNPAIGVRPMKWSIQTLGCGPGKELLLNRIPHPYTPVWRFAFQLAEENWGCVRLGVLRRGVTIMGRLSKGTERPAGEGWKNGTLSHVASS